MKTINTLVADIYATINQSDRSWFNAELAHSLSSDLTRRLQTHLGERTNRATLRLSKMGPVCPRQLWASIHARDAEEPLPAWATIKYSYGHILESLVLTLAKAAGHRVEGEQDELTLDGIAGHRDAVIDGCLVDIKSSSSRGFTKFKDGSLKFNDDFGYLDQLDGYVVASYEDPLVTVKDKGYILAIDKQLGHMVLYEHIIRERHIRDRISSYKRIAALPEPPACECGTKVEGKSGNVGLDVKASYSAYKHFCFPELRTFLYANGPVYLTKVVRKPDVPEIDRHGSFVC